MPDTRTQKYAEMLSRLIQAETISQENQSDKSKFYRFHDILRGMFPHIFSACTFEDFDGSFLMLWKGTTGENPVLLMNHHDVVEAPGKWTHAPFAGEIADGRLWGRGTLDTKGGLWAMLQAADELAAEGFSPRRDTYFLSTCDEECGGTGADRISKTLLDRGIRLDMVLDEGGMIVHEPIGGANGDFAMVGLGEKGCADLKFTARSSGGHASTPGKNTPLVRLGKFMAAVEKSSIFRAEISPTVHEMFSRLADSMNGPLKFILSHSRLFAPILIKVMPMVSGAAGAMLKTTLAFTMASGSEGTNVLPQEAWVVGNMRFSHHQGGEASIAAVSWLAKKFDIETEVLSPGFSSPLSDYKTDAFRLVESAVSRTFPGVRTSPYMMTGASDSRFMSRICDNCLRFAPFRIDNAQLDTIHGIDENVSLSTLAPAVDFYRHIITEV
ncbi:MAG: M20/M25/M40 family metallo-hydrolase [Clostridiales bacterium]|nr:M20/M25/M40 family metallo-hydrolase [Clostridiales bacterium]